MLFPRFRSRERDLRSDIERLSTIYEAVERAIQESERELVGLMNRLDDARARAAFLYGDVIDAGSKALTSDLLGMTGYGYVVGYPEAVIYGLSEEHGNIDFSASAKKPAIGERLRIVPNHACPVSNLYDNVHLVSGDHVVRTERVAARGRVD